MPMGCSASAPRSTRSLCSGAHRGSGCASGCRGCVGGTAHPSQTLGLGQDRRCIRGIPEVLPCNPGKPGHIGTLFRCRRSRSTALHAGSAH